MLKRVIAFLVIVFAMAGFTVTASAYQVSATKYVYVDDDGVTTRYATNEEILGELFKNEKITLAARDVVDKDINGPIETGMIVTVSRSKAVTITLDGVPRMVYTLGNTVGEVLSENEDVLGVKYVINDYIEADPIEDGMEINLSTSIVKTYTKTEKILFGVKYIDDDTMPKGTETVITAGVDGEMKIDFEETYVNDMLVSTKETGRTIASQPVEQVIKRGTSTKVDGYTYTSAFKVVATGYTPNDAGCSGTTASGTTARFGVIAADTKVLPFGTKIYVPGYGVGVVEDRGGAIKGNRIDLCYNGLQEALNWGVRDLTVYILE